MPAILVVLFILVPLVEIVIIIQVGQVIGAWWTVGLLVADSMLGAWLLRREGARAWRAFREALAEGRWPGDEVAQGSMVIVGGTLLLTPGFLTDVVGFLLLVPVSRRIASRTVRRRVRLGADGHVGRAKGGGRSAGGDRDRAGGTSRRPTGRSPGPGAGAGDAGILDVEVVEIRREGGPHDTTDGSDDDAGGSDRAAGAVGDGEREDPPPR